MQNYKYILEVMLEYLDEGIIVTDIDANVTLYNEPATNIAGITPDEAIGRNVLDIFRDLTPSTSTFYKVLKSQKPILNYVQTYLNYQGKKVSTLTSTIPLMENGNLVGALEIYRDLTQVKELSDKITNLQSQLFKPINNKTYSNGTIYDLNSIVGNHKSIEELKNKIIKISKSSSPILVCGETGTGKELVVQSIHNESSRKNRPFIAQNCAAIPKTLLESILFGTSSGSFTGAIDKPGLFELANGGTLFLDEINSMDIELQGKLLRVLQDKVIRKVGGNKTFKVDVRVIVSTNELPLKLVQEKKLRNDLFYRLNVVSLQISPLRHRKEDIPVLIKHFLDIYNDRLNKNVKKLSVETMDLFYKYHWPGNVRELEYALEGIMNFIDGDIIELKDLPTNIFKLNSDIERAIEDKGNLAEEKSLKCHLREYEIKIIKEAIKKANGNCAQAARKLEMPRQTLHNKIKKLNIKWATKID